MRAMGCLAFVALPLFLAACSKNVSTNKNDAGLDPAAAEQPEASDARAQELRILEKSDDYEALTKAALALCASSDPKDVDRVVEFSKDPEFLARLDSEKAYYTHPRPVQRVLAALARLPDGRGETAFLALMSNQAFMAKQSYRPGWLIAAAGDIRNPTEAFLDHFETQATLQQVGPSSVIQPLAHMRSAEGHKRIDKWFSRLSEPIYKIANLYGFIELRNEPGIVRFCREVLANPKESATVRNSAVEVLFDDLPLTRFANSGSLPRKPPPRYDASTEVLEELSKIAILCSTIEVGENARRAIKKGGQEIEGILEFRRSGGPQRVASLIGKLDSGNYAVRESATRSLKKYGVLADPGLRSALKTTPNGEVKRRIEEILARPEPPAEELEAVPVDPHSVLKELDYLPKRTDR